MNANSAFTQIWPVVSTVVNVLIGVLGFLLVRWLGSTIRIAILELKEELRDTYAIKKDVERLEKDVELLEDKISLSQQMNTGFSNLSNMFRGSAGSESSLVRRTTS